jgi:signal transduction histidine kinase
LREVFSQRLIENQERERERISSDMHDSLGQSLRIIRRLARTAQTEAHGTGRDAALAEIAGLAERTQEEMTEIAYGLRPHQLDTLGLSKTVESMIRRVERSCGIRFATDIAPVDAVVQDDARIHVFRIIQEAVSNILQHSNATEARVVLAADEGHLHLQVEDNGKGFPAHHRNVRRDSRDGLGLMGMHERARIVGGELDIRSEAGQGTTLTLTIPMRRSSDG